MDEQFWDNSEFETEHDQNEVGNEEVICSYCLNEGCFMCEEEV